MTDVLETDTEDIEARARRQGWRPESEWNDGGGRRQRPTSFLTAQEFLDKIDDNAPVLRERLRHVDDDRQKLEAKLNETTGKLDEVSARLAETTGLVKTLHDQSRAVGQRAYEKAKRDIQAEQRAAIAEADPERFDQAQKRLEELEAEKPPPAAVETPAPRVTTPAPPTPQIEPATTAWVANNPWFQKDQILNGWAIEREAEIRREFPAWSTSDVLDEVKQRTMEKYPERFGINPRRRAGSPVVEPGAPRSERRTGERPGRSFEDLPEDHKETFRQLQKTFKDRGIDYKREEYLADYQWD